MDRDPGNLLARIPVVLASRQLEFSCKRWKPQTYTHRGTTSLGDLTISFWIMAGWERLGLVGLGHSKLWWWPISPWAPTLSWEREFGSCWKQNRGQETGWAYSPGWWIKGLMWGQGDLPAVWAVVKGTMVEMRAYLFWLSWHVYFLESSAIAV